MTGYAKQGPVGGWIDYPNTTTPILSSELNGLDTAVYQLKTQVFDPMDYGAVGDGVADDTAAITTTIQAWLTAGRGVLRPSPLPYLISGPLTVTPSANQTTPMLISGYGATFILSSATAGWVFTPTASTSFRNFAVAGLQCRIGSAATTDAFLFSDGGHSQAFMYAFTVRDCSVEGISGSGIVPICNGLHITGSTTGVFQLVIENFESTLTANVTGTGILVDGTASATSSIRITNPNVTGYKYGVQVGTSAVPLFAQIDGGTVLSAQNEGVRMFVKAGSSIKSTHIENNWLSAANLAAGKGGLYYEGAGDIIALEDIRGSGSIKQKWAVEAKALAGTILVLGRSITSTNEWLKIDSSDTTGTIITVGMKTSQIDFSAVSAGSPNMVFQGQTGTGTPEAAVAAPIGTLFHRLDGGAGTSLYVKESGTGNTGWVGK